MIELSREVWEEIATDLRKTRGATSRTAKNLGYDIRLVLQVAEAENEPRIVREEKYGGLGRPELRDYAVARKKAWQVWDNTQPALAKARAEFEEGSHEMVTGRDGDWLILYSIPRRVPLPRPDYFQPRSF